MAKMFTAGFKPKSTTKKAKTMIRNEMLSFFNPKEYIGAKTRLDAMRLDANAGNGGYGDSKRVSDYQKGAYLVDAGCLRCYYSDISQFLSKIYGKKNVEKWNGEKIHNTYKHLVGREYDSMLREREKKQRGKK